MEIESISASGIKTYETCPKKFYAEYILKLEADTHPAALMGSCLHWMFENACNAAIKGDDTKKHDPFYWRNMGISEFNVPRNLHKTLDDLTRVCIDWGYMDNLGIVSGLEKNVEFMLPCGVKVRGFIDRLNIDPEWKAEIIDLKTQKNAFTQEELDNNWQAIIYFLGTLKDNPFVVGDVKVSFWVLRHRIQEVILPQDAFDELYNKVNGKTLEILKADGTECRPSGLCRFCISPDCVHRKGSETDFGSRELSESARELKEILSKIRSQKDVNYGWGGN